MTDRDASKPKQRTRRSRGPRRPFRDRLVRFIIANAVTLSVVAVVALPLSYVAGQRVIRHRELSKLDSPDPAAFEDGLGYVYTHAPENAWAREAALERVATLPPERAAELLWALGHSLRRSGEPLPEEVVLAGAALLERSGFAQKFVVYHQLEQLGVGEDEAVLAALATALDDPDDRRFLQAVEFYDARFLWLREHVPDSGWLRWAVLLSHSEAALTQLRAAQVLGELRTTDDPRHAEALARLARSENAMVRSEALDAAAGFAKVADNPVPYEQVLIALTEDENETLARRAWITLGLLNPLSGFSADWRSFEPAVAEAMLWAAVKTNPDRPEPALGAWDAGLAYEAALALHQSPAIGKQQTEGSLLDSAGTRLMQGVLSNPTTTEEQLLYWRCLPVLRRNLMWVGGERESVYRSLFHDAGASNAIKDRNPILIASTCYYTGTGFQPSDASDMVSLYQIAWHEMLPRLPMELTQERYVFYEVLGLLWPGGPIAEDDLIFEFEGINTDELEYPLADHFFHKPPWQARLYEHAVGSWGASQSFGEILDNLIDPIVMDLVVVSSACATIRSDLGGVHQISIDFGPHHPAAINELIRSSSVDRRITGVLIAGMSKEHPTLINGVTTEFIRKHPDLDLDDLHEFTDAQLADLGLRRVDALTTLLHIAETATDRVDRAEQIALLKLALWMRGDLGDAFTPEAEAMLEDDRLPTSTVLMCLLHMQRPAALYYLFDHPDANTDPPIDLYDLFVSQRWWHVFSRLVPDPDLELWLWGDPGAQAFQFEVMRQWVQVHRWRLDDGWWPGDEQR